MYYYAVLGIVSNSVCITLILCKLCYFKLPVMYYRVLSCREQLGMVLDEMSRAHLGRFCHSGRSGLGFEEEGEFIYEEEGGICTLGSK